MEQQFKLDYNGQQVQKEDLELLGTTSGLADDRVLAELLRLTPFDGTTVARGILPYLHQTSGGQQATVDVDGATGSVLIRPFRAVLGSRTAVGTDAVQNWRDIRSAIYTGGSLAIAANSSGNPRWDLIYAAVAVDVNGTSTTRKVKDPATKVVTDQSVSTYKQTTVAIGVVAGVTDPSPVWPAVPGDGGGTYNIPLAYVRVPNGFSATSTVDERDIALIASTPLEGVRPAKVLFNGSGAYLTAANQGSWGSSGTAPRLFLPGSMNGGETLVVPIGFNSGEFADGTILDDTRDWRGRLTRFWVQTATGATAQFPWSGVSTDSIIGGTPGVGLGNTCVPDNGTNLRVAFCTLPISAAQIAVIADPATGYLKLKVLAGTPGANDIALFWIDFSGPIENYRRP